MSETSVLVIGACGLIGRHVLRSFRESGIQVAGTCHHKNSHGTYQLDLRQPDISGIQLRFTHALILSGVTKVAACERNPDGTRELNVKGTLELVKQLHASVITPVFFSSDYVFSGKSGSYSEDSPTEPVVEYGRQKVAVETGMHKITGGRHLVLRLGKVFTLEKGDKTFLDEMASTLKKGGTVKAAYDQMINPLLIDDLIRSVRTLIDSGALGLFQICDGTPLSRYEIARQLKNEMGESAAGQIERISIDDLGIRTPKNVRMENRKARELGCTFTSLQDSIKVIAANYR